MSKIKSSSELIRDRRGTCVHIASPCSSPITNSGNAVRKPAAADKDKAASSSSIVVQASRELITHFFNLEYHSPSGFTV